MATKKLTFASEGGNLVSTPVTAADDGAITISLTIADGKPHRIAAQHSINGEEWQPCGTADFADGHIELTIDGLRAGVQKVRFVVFGTEAEIGKAEYV